MSDVNRTRNIETIYYQRKWVRLEMLNENYIPQEHLCFEVAFYQKPELDKVVTDIEDTYMEIWSNQYGKQKEINYHDSD